VPVVKNTVCNTKGLSLTNKEVCAGGEVGKGSCRGDSGGGMFLRESEHGVGGKAESPWFLLGVVSYGGQACGMGTPDVYTRVSKYVEWIKQQINK
jgi:secreted trypsin-like serine protease